MNRFTDEQQLAIDVRDTDVLVSAAAGSGKTSVLVERIIGRITSAEDAVDVDRLLVMTFTNAAAAEMRDRIRAAIDEKIDELRKDPDSDVNVLSDLERQAILVHNAMITTIHGFCKSVISDHFEELSIDPNFRVADENECLLMMQDALDKCMEDAYEKADPAFLRAAECFSGAKSDKMTADLVIPIYRFITANPDPEKFVRECCGSYNYGSLEEFAASPFMKNFMHILAGELERLEQKAQKAVKLIDEFDDLEPYRAAVSAYEAALTGIREEALSEDPGTYNTIRNLLAGISAPAFGRISDKNLDDESIAAKNEVKKLRDDVKSGIATLADILCFDLETAFTHILQTGEVLGALADLVLEFGRTYDDIKRDSNVIDFNDMEHMAIKILENSEIAALYREHFEEIYVDEYQDSNTTQEMLVRLIMRSDPGNVFQVGDVKQSIYRFRQARPDIFLDKYNTYDDTPGSGGRRILLNDNFRSRRQVVDAVNEVFSKIMKRDLGGIEYDNDAALKFGATCYKDDISREDDIYRTELVIGIRDELSAEEFEANVIAGRISSMIASGYMIFDKAKKTVRPVSYGDFTILVRSVKKFEPVFRKVFAACGIPLAVTGREGYFGTKEIKTVLDFLSAVDNSLCDIPLATVARSPVGGFSDADLAALTAASGSKKCLYERIRDAEGVSEELRRKCDDLLELLRRYKVMSTYMPVHALISDFIDNEYGDYVRCMSNPAQRMANLSMLLSKAEDYGRTSFKGLYQFVRYMDQIRRYEIDDGEAGIVGENDDVVRLMTMHASKGLEFPVCFLTGLEKRRNTRDESGKLIWSITSGFGCDHTDPEKRVVVPTLPKMIVGLENRRESIAEEMRVLYVAMTRAREKLIMVACDKEDGFEAPSKSPEECLSYLDMLKAARNEDGVFENIDISYVNEANLVISRFEDRLDREEATDELLKIVRSCDKEDAIVREEIPEYLSRVGFTYPHPLNPDLVAKLSVSQLKHKAIEEAIARGEELVPEGRQLFDETEPETYIPKFMRKEGETATGGTFYGTAFHRIMELWEYPKDLDIVTAEDVDRFAQAMLEARRMEREQVDAIRPDDVAFFLNSELAARMKAAKSSGRLFREQPFVIGVPEGGETVLVQGIIDAYFTEDDGITVVDYKTDRVTGEEMLIKRYRTQLEYYGTALSQITGRPVRSLVIYSTHLRSAICVSSQASL
ncbi:MAG: helicase-exonuclease AddAB subunit AddA [Lachnospiraceae bacterium]|nr:helicase-exonuclease AddAB subunit AddA [Lachnospiraceae bacterium]